MLRHTNFRRKFKIHTILRKPTHFQ